MILNEPSVVNLIKAAAPVGDDVIINALSRVPVSDLTALAAALGEPVLVPLPGPVLVPNPGDSFGVLNESNDMRTTDRRAVWFCDVRILNEDGFPSFLKKHGSVFDSSFAFLCANGVAELVSLFVGLAYGVQRADAAFRPAVRHAYARAELHEALCDHGAEPRFV